MENNTVIQTNTIFKCNKTHKWIRIDKDYNDYVPYPCAIRCSKCGNSAVLNFIHDEYGDHYGPGIHKDCDGRYVFLCVKRKDHAVPIDDNNNDNNDI